MLHDLVYAVKKTGFTDLKQICNYLRKRKHMNARYGHAYKRTDRILKKIYRQGYQYKKAGVIVMGIAMIVYGITEIVNSLAINKVRNEVFSNSNLPTEHSKKKIAGDDRRASDDEDEYVEYVEEKD